MQRMSAPGETVGNILRHTSAAAAHRREFMRQYENFHGPHTEDLFHHRVHRAHREILFKISVFFVYSAVNALCLYAIIYLTISLSFIATSVTDFESHNAPGIVAMTLMKRVTSASVDACSSVAPSAV